MLLKSLEINGFKSFAQKSVFAFPAGIIAIVGPNGSGKSNIIDALRWLLGEREAKNLRGGKIGDLIFAGTPKKSRLSMARVTLTFDNDSGKIPSEFKEITVSRQVSRDGNSQYFINESPVRLKDIIDFFSRIRLGTRGLTIIGQGSADIFVQSLPSQRMTMIEEILGLREFQIKKAESCRRLQHTKVNLDKVSAMIQEVLPRLRMLKRQTAKWERRVEIETELSLAEKKFFCSKIRTLQEESRKIREPLPEIEAKITSQISIIKEKENELKKTEQISLSPENLINIQKSKRDFFSSRTSLERELFKMETLLEKEQSASTTFSFEDATQALRRIHKALPSLLSSGSLEEIKSEISRLHDFLDELLSARTAKKETESLKKEKDAISERINDCNHRIEELEKEEQRLSHGVAHLNEEFKKAFRQLDEARKELEKLESQKSRVRFEEEKIAYRLEELEHQMKSLEVRAEDIVKEAKNFFENFSEKEMNDLERRIMRLRGELASIGEVDNALLREAQEVEAHYEFLKKESEDLSRATEHLQELIVELEKKISKDFHAAFRRVNEEFNNFFRLMFNGGFAKMKVVKKESFTGNDEGVMLEGEVPVVENKEEIPAGIDIELNIPQKKISSLDMLSGGEKSLVSLAVLFALISVSPPPFLVLDEADAALDEKNSKRFADLIKSFSSHTQFIIVTHNRVTMEAAQVLYGITMDESGCSKVLSLKLEKAEKEAH